MTERGLVPLKEDDLRRIAAAAGLSYGLFERLVAVARLFRPFFSFSPAGRPDEAAFGEAFDAAAELGAKVAAMVQVSATALLARLEAEREEAEDAERLRPEKPGELWQRLADCPPRHWAFLARHGREYQSPGMAQRLLEESERAEARGEAHRALAAAHAALAAADGAGRPAGLPDPDAIEARGRERLGAGTATAERVRELARGVLEELGSR